ncbi:MAG: hypothetical protein Crog4KO_29210 [Crocinitomicaceae bacterium]
MLFCCLCANVSWSQDKGDKLPDDPKTDTWEKEKERLKYKRGKDYNGPEDWNSSEPTDIRDNRYVPSDELQRRMYGSSSSGSGSGGSGGSTYGGGSNGGGTLKYKPQQVQRQRQKNFKGFNRGGGNGTLKYDPKVKRPEPAKRPNPRVRPSRRSSSGSSSSSRSSGSSSAGASSGFFNALLIILVVVLVVILLYFMLRNRQPTNAKIVVDVEDEWNPEVITKTELELKLEAAMEREDFRECVRIYFTFILKELIKKGWIRWKKEKTNHHYVMEMGGRDGSLGFMECVRIYDLVWYGEYQIDRDIFEMLQPTLLNYYKSLDPSDE